MYLRIHICHHIFEMQIVFATWCIRYSPSSEYVRVFNAIMTTRFLLFRFGLPYLVLNIKFETVYLLWGVVAQWLERQFETWEIGLHLIA